MASSRGGAPMGPYAGILPWARRPTDRGQEIVVLLGRERMEPGWRDGGRWSDFGGGTEPNEDADEIEAAARECYEESMGMLGSRAQLESALRAAAADGTLASVRSPKGAVVYLLEVPYEEALPVLFERARAYASDAAAHMPRACRKDASVGYGNQPAPLFPPKGFYEKTAVAWVPIALLRRMVAEALPGAQRRARGGRSGDDNTQDDPGILRDDFVRTAARLFSS